MVKVEASHGRDLVDVMSSFSFMVWICFTNDWIFDITEEYDTNDATLAAKIRKKG